MLRRSHPPTKSLAAAACDSRHSVFYLTDLCLFLLSGQEVSELPTSPWELGAGLHKSSADSSASQPSLVPPRQMQPQEVAPNSARAAASANEVPQFVPRAVRQAQRQPAESHFEVTAAKVVWALQKYFKVCLALDPQVLHCKITKSYIDVMLQTPADTETCCSQVQKMNC